MSAFVVVGIGLLGGLGAVARLRIDRLVQLRANISFPLGTFTVNVLGSFCFGLLTGAGVGGDALLLTGIGLLGSFTTFSTWMLEAERLGEDGEDRWALANLGLSLAGGLAAASLGWALGAAW